MGIKIHENYLAETAEEHKQFTIGKLPKGNIWFCDTDGLGTPGYGLCMSAEDMAKIGLLNAKKIYMLLLVIVVMLFILIRKRVL